MRYGSVCSGIEAATVAWHPLGWEPAFFSEIEPAPRSVLAHHYPDVPCHGDFTTIGADQYGSIDLLVGEPPASPSALQDLEADWMMTVATSPLNFLDLLKEQGPSGWFGRTSLASCHQTEDGMLVPFSEGWSNSGMGSPTECLTLSTLEWPSAAAVCSLSDVFETQPVPQRFFLSATACKGILRRAEKRGKKLPVRLQEALLKVAQVENLMEQP